MLIIPKFKRLLLPSAFIVLGLLVIVSITGCGSRPAESVGVRIVSAQAAGEDSVSPDKALASAPQNSQPNSVVAQAENPSTVARSAKKAPPNDPAPAYSVQAPPPSQSSSASTEPAAPIASAPATAPAADPAVEPAASNLPPKTNLEIKPEVGFQAPDFSLQTLDGQTIRLSDLRGRPVVISYWASWCEPCKEELPILNNLSQEYSSAGIQVITVDAIEQDTLDKVRGIVNQLGINLTVLLDQQDQFHSSYQQLFFPTSYFVDSNGIIRFVKLGSATAEELRAQVDRLVNNQYE